MRKREREKGMYGLKKEASERGENFYAPQKETFWNEKRKPNFSSQIKTNQAPNRLMVYKFVFTS